MNFDFILFGIVDLPVYTLPMALMADISCVNIRVKRRDRINEKASKKQKRTSNLGKQIDIILFSSNLEKSV